MNTKKRILISAVCIASALVAFEMRLDWLALALFAFPFIALPNLPRHASDR